MKKYFLLIIEYFQQNIFEIACAILFSLLLLTGCSTVKEIPVSNTEKIIIKDSLIYVHDSITITIPFERVVEIKPSLDTSIINTSYAKSIAFLDTNLMTINHSLEQKGVIKTPIDTVFITKTKEVSKEKEVPVYVDKPIPIRDNQFWIYCIYFYLSILLILIKLYIKFFK